MYHLNLHWQSALLRIFTGFQCVLVSNPLWELLTLSSHFMRFQWMYFHHFRNIDQNCQENCSLCSFKRASFACLVCFFCSSLSFFYRKRSWIVKGANKCDDIKKNHCHCLSRCWSHLWEIEHTARCLTRFHCLSLFLILPHTMNGAINLLDYFVAHSFIRKTKSFFYCIQLHIFYHFNILMI